MRRQDVPLRWTALKRQIPALANIEEMVDLNGVKRHSNVFSKWNWLPEDGHEALAIADVSKCLNTITNTQHVPLGDCLYPGHDTFCCSALVSQ